MFSAAHAELHTLLVVVAVDRNRARTLQLIGAQGKSRPGSYEDLYSCEGGVRCLARRRRRTRAIPS